MLPTCRQEEPAKVVSGPPAFVIGPVGRVKESATPSQEVTALMGSSLGSLRHESKSGVYPVCHMGHLDLDPEQTGLSRSLKTAKMGCKGCFQATTIDQVRPNPI